ncbi:lipoprotein [gut metagenome]|uniref:Lipoprotein n=1 Tax=gut metagenome TaxID=749906 RepID=J9FU42_9ZZZZ
MTETDIAYDALPDAVKQAFAALTQYKNWKCDDVDMLERKGMEVVYVIEIEQGRKEIDLYFDAKGNLLKEVADTDDNSANYLPAQLPGAVTQLLNERYAGYQLLDVETDKETKLLEVDILFQGQNLEVCFNPSSYAWVSTSQDVLFASLPQAVKEAAKNAVHNHPGYELEDDEAEKVTTPAGIYYIVELEMDGKPDIPVKIKEDGTPLK